MVQLVLVVLFGLGVCLIEFADHAGHTFLQFLDFVGHWLHIHLHVHINRWQKLAIGTIIAMALRKIIVAASRLLSIVGFGLQGRVILVIMLVGSLESVWQPLRILN